MFEKIVNIVVDQLGCDESMVTEDASILDDLGAVYFSVSVVTAIVLALLFRGVAEAITILQQLLDTKRSEDFKKLHGDRRVFPEVQPETTQPFANAPPVHYAYPSDIKTVDMPE